MVPREFSGGQRPLQRLGVHMRHHQHVALFGVDGYAGDQPVRPEIRRECVRLSSSSALAWPLYRARWAPQEAKEALLAQAGSLSLNSPVNAVVMVDDAASSRRAC